MLLSMLFLPLQCARIAKVEHIKEDKIQKGAMITVADHTAVTQGEDADCFCTDTDVDDEIDFDTEFKYPEGQADLCYTGGADGEPERCTEYCEKKPEKYKVTFEGKHQTLSDCKGDDDEMKCRCFQFYESDPPHKPRQGTFDAVNDAFSNGGHLQYDGHGGAQNMKNCYLGCRDQCKGLKKKFAGCAFPY